MMKLAYEINKVQESLKQMYSIEEYNRIVTKLKAKAGDDLEVLAHMSTDRQMSPEVRLFAVAAMGE